MSREDVTERVMEMTDGRGATIVFNTVGDPYFPPPPTRAWPNSAGRV